MSIRTIQVTITGVSPLLQNNPQTVDRFNPYSRAMARINARKTKRTDDDYLELRDLEMRAKIYWDDALGIHIPSTWLTAAIAKNSFKICKVSKDGIRGAVFATEDRLPLVYRDMKKVKTPEDIVKNDAFRLMMTLRQGQVRVCKAVPIFHDWSFTCGLDFDDKEIDPADLERVLQHAAKYGGFGDFRPTFGRALASISHE
jgi:hypothetical protein